MAADLMYLHHVMQSESIIKGCVKESNDTMSAFILPEIYDMALSQLERFQARNQNLSLYMDKLLNKLTIMDKGCENVSEKLFNGKRRFKFIV